MDGKYDSLHFNIEIPLKDSEAIHSVQLLLIFDYQLQVNELLFAFLLSRLLYIKLVLEAVPTGSLKRVGHYKFWANVNELMVPVFQRVYSTAHHMSPFGNYIDCDGSHFVPVVQKVYGTINKIKPALFNGLETGDSR